MIKYTTHTTMNLNYLQNQKVLTGNEQLSDLIFDLNVWRVPLNRTDSSLYSLPTAMRFYWSIIVYSTIIDLWFFELSYLRLLARILLQLKSIRSDSYFTVKGTEFSTKVKNMCENDFYLSIHRCAGTERDYCECRKTNNRWVDFVNFFFFSLEIEI